MYNEDIDGSIAHVTMLAEQGIVTLAEAEQIVTGLEKIREKIKSGEIVFTVDDEDIHMASRASSSPKSATWAKSFTLREAETTSARWTDGCI